MVKRILMYVFKNRFTIWPLVVKLAESGHNITFLSPHHPKVQTLNPNITEMTPDIFSYIGMDYDPAEVRLTGGVKAVEDLWPG